MDNFSKLNLKPSTIFKYLGIGLLALLAIGFIVQVFSRSFPTFYQRGEALYQDHASYDSSYMAMEKLDGDVMLSSRNVANYITPPVEPGFSSGSDAEDFEIKEYSANIETRNLEETCGVIQDLKSREYVIFENSNEYDRGCNFTFKTETDRVDEVLLVLESLDPKDLSENVHTIKKRIDDFTSEAEILEKKLESINDTLESALEAYDEITDVATRSQNAEALAKIIDSKIGIIERLTRERINVTSQLERLERAKFEQLDRLEYTYFYVHVTENKYIDGELIRDSWKSTIKNFVRNVNDAAQGITIDLLSVLVLAVKYILYIVILLFVAKYGWRFVKYFWNK